MYVAAGQIKEIAGGVAIEQYPTASDTKYFESA